jgi:hypothetical protein
MEGKKKSFSIGDIAARLNDHEIMIKNMSDRISQLESNIEPGEEDSDAVEGSNIELAKTKAKWKRIGTGNLEEYSYRLNNLYTNTGISTFVFCDLAYIKKRTDGSVYYILKRSEEFKKIWKGDFQTGIVKSIGEAQKEVYEIGWGK